MSKKIKASELLAAVQEIATEQPDHIYEQPGLYCVYQDNGRPSCLVGHALIRCGAPAELLARMDEETSGGLGIEASFSTYSDYLEADSAEAIFELAEVQANQDIGKAWGKAAGVEAFV